MLLKHTVWDFFHINERYLEAHAKAAHTMLIK